MQVVTESPLVVIDIGGGAQVHDKAEGIAKAIFLNISENGRNIFHVFVNDKKLVFPVSLYPEGENNLKWCGSQLFTFEKIGVQFLKITELDDQKNVTSVFVDLQKTDSFYDMYTALPKEVSEAESMKKIEEVTHKRYGLLFNRHGTALITYEDNYVLYFASPYEEKVKKIVLDTRTSFFMRDARGDFSFKSKCGFINIRKHPSTLYKINNDEATFIPLYNRE